MQHKLLTMKTAQVRNLEKNARKHSEAQIKQIMKSIEMFGFLSPIVVDGEDRCVAGNGRLEAARRLEMESIPAIRAQGLSPAKLRSFALVDNRLGDLSDWDAEILKDEVSLLLEEIDLSEIGFSREEMEALKITDIEPIDLDEGEKGTSTKEKAKYHCPKCGFCFEV